MERASRAANKVVNEKYEKRVGYNRTFNTIIIDERLHTKTKQEVSTVR